MRESLAAWLPIDPGFAPFGVRWLRGLNALPFALVALVGVLSGLGAGLYAMAWLPAPSVSDLLMPLVLLVLQSLIGYTPLLMIVTATDNLASRTTARRRAVALTAATLLGALAYASLGRPLTSLVHEGWYGEFALLWQPMLVRALLWGGLFTTLLALHRHQRDAARALHERRAQRLDFERQANEARLHALQAQIEPHFLFNTLAHVQRLIAVQPAQGRAMLHHLGDYLHSALPQMRLPVSSLARELDTARAYLEVQRIRMGERLRVQITAPAALADAGLPPLMLLTLVENALQHGLSPKPQGGTVRIEARQRDGWLEVVVADDGVGLTLGVGGGRGLANIQQRLAALYGSEGSLEVDSAGTEGVRAVLRLPLARVPAGVP